MAKAEEAVYLGDGLFREFYGDYVYSLDISSGYGTPTRLDDAFRSAKWYVADRLTRHDHWYRYNMEVWHLFGDPMLRLRLPEP